MTEHTPEKVADLIAEARDYLDRECNVSQWPNLVSQLADALEATVREMHARELHHFEEEQARAKAEAEVLTTRLRLVDYRAAIHDIRTLLETPTDKRGVTWWAWIEDGLGGSLHDDLRRILSRIPEHPKEG